MGINGGPSGPIEFCGQKLTKPVQTTEGFQFAEHSHLPLVEAPQHSILPPHIASNSPKLANWSNVLVLSRSCERGYTVEVAASPYLRTVGIAYSHDRSGIAALLLGRLKNAPDSLQRIRVYAFRHHAIAAQAELGV